MPDPGQGGAPAPAARPTGSFYRPELDGVRALAFFAVFLGHSVPAQIEVWTARVGSHAAAWISAAIRAGLFGVDLFFALSAYLITEILLRERRAHGRVDAGAFWVRRILRIWPLYFVFLGGVLLISPLVLPSDRLSTGYLVANLCFVGNWATALHGEPASAILHLWSVSIEEQFYLSWPLVMRRLGRRALVALMVGLVLLGMATRAYLVAKHGHGRGHEVWFNTFARLDPIACGALLAVLLDGRVPVLGRARARALIAAGALVVYAVTRVDPLLDHPLGAALGYALVAVGCVLVLLGALALGPRSLLAGPVPVYVGRISYGAYVFHYLFVRILWLRAPALPIALLALPPTIGAAALSYRYLEAPFLTLKRRFTRMDAR